MSISSYAQIQNGTVLNIILASSTDYFNPTYTWVNLTGVTPIPSINWTWNGSIFSPPAPPVPNDAYGNPVSFSTNGTTDTYTVSNGVYIFNFAAGTSQSIVYLSMAIQVNLALFQIALNNYINSRYTTQTRINLLGLYLNAQANNLTNRSNYLLQLFTWQNIVIEYVATYTVTVEALTNLSTIASTVGNFTSLTTADPLVTAIAAIQIPN